ncbi:MAG: hypothetical protein RSB11_08230 [Oscillospiraceae bacterium]
MKNKITETAPIVYEKEFTYTANQQSHKANVRTYISFSEYAKFVANVAYQVINEETHYSPFVLNLVFAQNLIAFFTDVKVPEDVNEFYDFINSGTIISDIKNAVGTFTVDGIKADIDRLIEFRKLEVANHSALDTLCNTLNDLLIKYDKKLGKSINPAQMEKVISKLSSMDITERGIVDALVDKIPKSKSAVGETEKQPKAESNVIDFTPRDEND